MDFKFSEEHIMIRDMVRDFAEEQLKPMAPILDTEHRFPVENVKKMGQLGLMGMLVPEQYGGSDTGVIAYSLAITEIAKACASTAVTTSVTNMVAESIYKFGTEEQKQKYIPKIASGEYLAGAFALTESGAGSDATALKTTAVEDGEEWVLNGSKIFITSGDVAGVTIVMAFTDKELGGKGVSAFLVEKDTPGMIVGKKEEKMGQNGSSTVELVFDNCRVPKANMLGKRGSGFKIAMTALDGGRVGIGSLALGIGKAALEAAIKYSKDRNAFGGPIAQFQAIQWMIADDATALDAAQLLILRAAWMKENGISPYTREASMAKVFATEAANKACNNAIQIHGGYGYTKEYHVERYYRDAKITTIYEGTSEIQRLVIARDLLK